jgi:hypothetical protein
VLHGAEAEEEAVEKKKQLHRATAGYQKVARTDVRDCQEPLLQKGSKRTLSVPSTLIMKIKELHRAHATTPRRTAGYQRVATD